MCISLSLNAPYNILARHIINCSCIRYMANWNSSFTCCAVKSWVSKKSQYKTSHTACPWANVSQPLWFFLCFAPYFTFGFAWYIHLECPSHRSRTDYLALHITSSGRSPILCGFPFILKFYFILAMWAYCITNIWNSVWNFEPAGVEWMNEWSNCLNLTSCFGWIQNQYETKLLTSNAGWGKSKFRVVCMKK